MQLMYREDILQANELQNISDAINDVCENCDAVNLRENINQYLVAILTELNSTLDPNNLKHMSAEQRECFQNYLGSLI